MTYKSPDGKKVTSFLPPGFAASCAPDLAVHMVYQLALLSRIAVLNSAYEGGEV